MIVIETFARNQLATFPIQLAPTNPGNPLAARYPPPVSKIHLREEADTHCGQGGFAVIDEIPISDPHGAIDLLRNLRPAGWFGRYER